MHAKRGRLRAAGIAAKQLPSNASRRRWDRPFAVLGRFVGILVVRMGVILIHGRVLNYLFAKLAADRMCHVGR